MNEIALHTATPDETVDLGRRLAGVLRRGDVVALVGPLGAGKTQLTRGIATGLGIDPRQVASPTFILMSEYDAATPLVHIDAYRIQSLADLESIGFTGELLSDSITVIEWADRIANELPADHLRIELDHAEGGRRVTLMPKGHLVERIRSVKLQAPSAARYEPCRTCKKPVPVDAATFPFCSGRCKLVDLNRWFSGGYGFSRPLEERDELADQ